MVISKGLLRGFFFDPRDGVSRDSVQPGEKATPDAGVIALSPFGVDIPRTANIDVEVDNDRGMPFEFQKEVNDHDTSMFFHFRFDGGETAEEFTLSGNSSDSNTAVYTLDQVDAGALTEDGADHTILVTVSRGDGLHLYLDGNLIGSDLTVGSSNEQNCHLVRYQSNINTWEARTYHNAISANLKNIRIGGTHQSSVDDQWDGPIYAALYWHRKLDANEARWLHSNYRLLRTTRIIHVPLIPTEIAEIIAPSGIVTGDITFSTTLDKVDTKLLTGEVASTFLTNLAEARSNAKTTSNSITYGLTLDQLQEYGALVLGAITFGLTLDQISVINKITSNAEILGITLDEIHTLNKIMSETGNFALVLDEAELNVKTTSESDTFGVILDKTGISAAERSVSFSAQIDLNQLETNQAILVSEYIQDLALDQQTSNIKTSEGLITFTTDLDYQTLKQLAANVSITLDTSLDYQFNADGAGTINAAITFLANLDQTYTKVITADKAFALILDLDQQHGNQLDKLEALTLVIQASDAYQNTRGVPGDISFDAQLDQAQTNTALRVGLMTFDTLLDKSIGTAGSTFGTVIAFATNLTMLAGTAGDVIGDVTYGLSLNQDTPTPEKITSANLGFDIAADIVTEINLTVDGQISLSTTMTQTEAKQLFGRSGITFGHLQGLASLGSAILGADINFSTIQNVQVSGFNLQFEIITPADRTYKVNIEDRTLLLDGENRTIRINKT